VNLKFGFTWQIKYNNITSLLFVYIVFGPILHILIIHNQYDFLFAAVVAIDGFLKSFIIISTHQQRHIASETGFKQDSPKPNSDSLIECTFY